MRKKISQRTLTRGLTLKPIFKSFFIALILCCFMQCTTVPGTGRKAVHIVPESQLVAMSAEAFDEMKQQTPISKNSKYIAQATRVSQRIASAVRHEMPDTDWEFVVFDNQQVNAFAMAGGKVGIYTGLLDLVKSDDELAFVIGHEIAHVTAHHSNERMSQQLLASGLSAAALMSTDNMNEETRAIVQTALGFGSQYGVLLPFSRLHENEADHLGLFYSARAGYDPRAAVNFWKTMQANTTSKTPEWMSTHPLDETRIRKLEELMPEAMAIYEQNKR